MVLFLLQCFETINFEEASNWHHVVDYISHAVIEDCSDEMSIHITHASSLRILINDG